MNEIQTLMCRMLLLELALVVCRLVCSFKANKIGKALHESSNWGQAAVVMGAVLLFYFSALLSPVGIRVKSWRKLKRRLRRRLLPGLLWWFFALGIFVVLVLLWKKHTKTDKGRIGRFLPKKEQLPLILLVLINAAVRVPMLGAMQRWDAGEYYYKLGTACQNYRFNLQSLLDNFRLCQHSNLGFSLAAAIGEFFSPRDSVGVLTVSLVLTLFAVVCLYFLLRDAWLKCSSWLAAGLALTISFTPIFLGTFAYVNPDYFLAVYFIFLLYSDYRKWNILSFASAVLVSQCKETGVLVVAGFYGFKIVADFVTSRGGIWARLKGVLNGSSLWIAMAAGAVYEALILRLGSLTTWVQNGEVEQKAVWSNTGLNCFGYNPGYIAYRLRQFFCVNFAWIISILVLCFVMTAFLRKLRRGSKNHVKKSASKYLGLLGAMTGFGLFGILYITVCLNRYNILFAVGWSVTGAIAYYCLIGHRQYKLVNTAAVLLLACLFFTQAFWNIDAVSSRLFVTVPISDKNTMLYTDLSGYFGDGLVNNYQYTWLDQALNKFLAEIEYDSDKAIFLPEEEEYGLHIVGNENVYPVVWDANKQKRVFAEGDADETVIQVWRESEFTDAVPEEMYIPLIKYYQVDEDRVRQLLEPAYDLSEKYSVTSYGGEIEYYRAIRKDGS